MMPDADCYDRFVVPQRFDGRVVLITGSTGIAAASAHRLAAEGAVVVASRTEEHCRSLVEAITSAGGAASYEVADLTEDGAADRSSPRPSTVTGASTASSAWPAAAAGVMATARHTRRRRRLGRHARPQRPDPVSRLGRRRPPDARPGPDADGQRGAILHMGSVTSTSPSPTYFATHAYAAAKGAIAALTRTMASYYAPKGSGECGLAGRHPHADGRAGRERPRIVEFATWKQSLVGRLLEPEDIAGSAAFLLSRDALAITGQVLDVDAGLEPDRRAVARSGNTS